MCDEKLLRNFVKYIKPFMFLFCFKLQIDKHNINVYNNIDIKLTIIVNTKIRYV